jgi:glycosyltransferase involved in cell wall biosynthesis
MALLEAQAAGLSAVAGAAGGVPAMVAEGLTASLVPPGDPAAFATAVAALLDDPARRQAMGAAAARRARAEHDIGGAAVILDALVRRLVA